MTRTDTLGTQALHAQSDGISCISASGGEGFLPAGLENSVLDALKAHENSLAVHLANSKEVW